MNRMYGKHLPMGDRFSACIEHTTGCWLWRGREAGKKGERYGMFTIATNTAILAHRLSYIIHNGPIPSDLWVLHKCDTPLCVNPDHLFLGTQQDNIADMIAKGRAFRGTTKGKKQRRVTEQEVLEMRRRYGAGESPKAIANDLGVGYGNLLIIVRGKTHKGI